MTPCIAGKIQYNYDGPTTTAMDEASHTYCYSSDGLDRLKSVTEPNSAVTSYGYDVLNNLTSVTMCPAGHILYNSDRSHPLHFCDRRVGRMRVDETGEQRCPPAFRH